MEDSSETRRFALPIVMVGLAVFFGAMRIEAFQSFGASLLGVGLPIGVVWTAQLKFSSSRPPLPQLSLMLSALVILAAFAQVARVLWGFHLVNAQLTPNSYRLVLLGLGLCAVLLEGAAARSAPRTKLAAWLGTALGFAAFLAGLPDAPQPQLLGQIVVAAVMGLWGGGLAGLVLGAGVARIGRGSDSSQLDRGALAAPAAKPRENEIA